MPTSAKKQGQLSEVVTDPPAFTTVAMQQQRALEAHSRAARKFSKVVESLVDLVGAQLTAYLGGVGETRAVREWIQGKRSSSVATRSKLQLALQIALELKNEGEEGVIEAWFQGLNPGLDDRPPAKLIRDAGSTELSTISRQILIAAREFANS